MKSSKVIKVSPRMHKLLHQLKYELGCRSINQLLSKIIKEWHELKVGGKDVSEPN
mgnify:CR=1 FL=1